jgi:hypothetical protein
VVGVAAGETQGGGVDQVDVAVDELGEGVVGAVARVGVEQLVVGRSLHSGDLLTGAVGR